MQNTPNDGKPEHKFEDGDKERDGTKEIDKESLPEADGRPSTAAPMAWGGTVAFVLGSSAHMARPGVETAPWTDDQDECAVEQRNEFRSRRLKAILAAKENEKAEKVVKEEAERKAKEEAEQKAKEEAERTAKEEASNELESTVRDPHVASDSGEECEPVEDSIERADKYLHRRLKVRIDGARHTREDYQHGTWRGHAAYRLQCVV